MASFVQDILGDQRYEDWFEVGHDFVHGGFDLGLVGRVQVERRGRIEFLEAGSDFARVHYVFTRGEDNGGDGVGDAVWVTGWLVRPGSNAGVVS